MLLDRLSTIKVERVYSSDLKRAFETTKIIFKDNGMIICIAIWMVLCIVILYDIPEVIL